MTLARGRLLFFLKRKTESQRVNASSTLHSSAGLNLSISPFFILSVPFAQTAPVSRATRTNRLPSPFTRPGYRMPFTECFEPPYEVFAFENWGHLECRFGRSTYMSVCCYFLSTHPFGVCLWPLRAAKRRTSSIKILKGQISRLKFVVGTQSLKVSEQKDKSVFYLLRRGSQLYNAGWGIHCVKWQSKWLIT